MRQRATYEAIGEPESRLRRPPAVPRALERLMVLDVILEHPDIVWLATPEEKVAQLTTLTGIPLEDPHLVIGQGAARQVRYFPDRLPLGIHHHGRSWSCICTWTLSATSSGASCSITPRCSRD